MSNQNNKSRLTLLESREELLEKVFEEARAKLNATTSDTGKYATLLQSLILQVRSASSWRSSISFRSRAF